MHLCNAAAQVKLMSNLMHRSVFQCDCHEAPVYLGGACMCCCKYNLFGTRCVRSACLLSISCLCMHMCMHMDRYMDRVLCALHLHLCSVAKLTHSCEICNDLSMQFASCGLSMHLTRQPTVHESCMFHSDAMHWPHLGCIYGSPSQLCRWA